MGQDCARGCYGARLPRSSNTECAPGLGAGRFWVSGNRSAVRVLAACAPSRSPRPTSIDPDLAIPFIRSSFPGMFPDEPALSLPREGIKFTISRDGSPSDSPWRPPSRGLALVCR
jgi:hypothetical protein